MTAEKLKIYFDITSSENNRIEGLCRLCKRVYKDLYGIYSNFKKHLKRQHPLEYRKAFCSQQEDDRSDEDISLEEGTESIYVNTNDKNNKSNRINLSIAKNLIIKCNLPLNLVENPAFRDFMKECSPRWEPMSTKKLKNTFLSSFKETVHTKIIESLQNVTDLSLTIDGWSDRRNRSFLGITCHFVDDQMIQKAYLIDFVRLKSPHTSENIQRQTEYVLDSYNIKEKVFRIITDNASNMIKAYKFGLSSSEEGSSISMDVVDVELSDNETQVPEDNDDLDPNGFHFITLQPDQNHHDSGIFSSLRISCFTHTLQLVIRDGLQKVSQVSKVLEKCQLLAQCSQKSTKIADILERLQKRIERTTLTRWNSEFLLIKSILSINREDLESITAVMDNPIRFSNTDLTIMKEIIDILEPFYEISVRCQGEKLATISLVVPSIVHLINHLRNFQEKNTNCFKFVQQLQSSIDKRFTGIIHHLKLIDVHENDPFHDRLYFMATVLDPAFKFYWIHELDVDITVQAQLKHDIVQMIINEIGKDSINSSKNTIPLPGTEIRSSSVTRSSIISSHSEHKRKKLFVYDEYLQKNNSSNDYGSSDPSKELEIYLNEPIAYNFSEYWQRSQLTSLKRLVIRLFSVQASSAPVERVFSHAGLICSSRRTRLNEKLFKDLVFLKVNQALL